jgi:ABC-type amino acid transport substrate-binding protein
MKGIGWVLSGALALTLGSAFQVHADTLDRIRDTGRFVIGHRTASPPFSFVNEKGEATGYSIDLCQRIAAAAKQALDLAKLDIAYVPLTAENRFAMLEKGEVDIVCGSTTNTLKRRERVAFTLLTFVTGAEMLVRTNSDIDSLSDLAGKKVGVLAGTTTETGLKKGLEKQFINTEVVTVKDHDDGLRKVEDGGIDGYVADRILLIGLARQARNPSNLMLTDRLYSHEPYALAVRRNDPDFRLVADRTLAALYRTGTIGEVFKKWFGPMGATPAGLLKALYVLQAIPEE